MVGLAPNISDPTVSLETQRALELNPHHPLAQGHRTKAKRWVKADRCKNRKMRAQGSRLRGWEKGLRVQKAKCAGPCRVGWEWWIFPHREQAGACEALRQGTGRVRLLFLPASLGWARSEWLGQLSGKETVKSGGAAGEMGSLAEEGRIQENWR